MRAVVGLLLLAGTTALADDWHPEPNYFTGIYERIGRSDGPGFALINDLVRLSPDPTGKGIILTACANSTSDPAVRLIFDAFFEVPNFVTTVGAENPLMCQYFNDAGNYPILNCDTGGGARFTLWAKTDATEAECPL